MTPKQRMTVQNAWRSGEVQVVVATIAFGMGESFVLFLPFSVLVPPFSANHTFNSHRQARRQICGEDWVGGHFMITRS